MKLRRAEPMPQNDARGYDKGQFEIVPWCVHPENEYEFTWTNPHCKFNLCRFKIRKGDATPPTHHGWDGNREAPTITPSIGCEQRCGWHGHITSGESNP